MGENINNFLIEHFGIIGVIIIVLAFAVMALAGYIYKLHQNDIKEHRQDKTSWNEERKEFRTSLDKNSEALNRNTTVIESLKYLFETMRNQ